MLFIFIFRDASGSNYGRGGKFSDNRDLGRGNNERWRRDDEGKAPPIVSRSGLLLGRRGRQDTDHLPEWAVEESMETGGGGGGGETPGTFDDSGKFRAEQNRLNGVR